jgi:hypothetical protein
MADKVRRPVPPQGLRSDSTAEEFRLLFLHRRAEDADRLTERLARLQWSGTRLANPDLRGWQWLLWRLLGRPETENCCPVCQETPFTGHTSECWLGQELAHRPHTPS